MCLGYKPTPSPPPPDPTSQPSAPVLNLKLLWNKFPLVPFWLAVPWCARCHIEKTSRRLVLFMCELKLRQDWAKGGYTQHFGIRAFQGVRRGRTLLWDPRGTLGHYVCLLYYMCDLRGRWRDKCLPTLVLLIQGCTAAQEQKLCHVIYVIYQPYELQIYSNCNWQLVNNLQTKN